MHETCDWLDARIVSPMAPQGWPFQSTLASLYPPFNQRVGGVPQAESSTLKNHFLLSFSRFLNPKILVS